MPRRNSNAVKSRPRAAGRITHILIDVYSGRQVSAGTKQDMLTQGEIANAEVHSWRYRVVPIGK